MRKLSFEVDLTPAQADDLAAELVDYIIRVEGIEIVGYWVEEADAE